MQKMLLKAFLKKFWEYLMHDQRVTESCQFKQLRKSSLVQSGIERANRLLCSKLPFLVLFIDDIIPIVIAMNLPLYSGWSLMFWFFLSHCDLNFS